MMLYCLASSVVYELILWTCAYVHVVLCLALAFNIIHEFYCYYLLFTLIPQQVLCFKVVRL